MYNKLRITLLSVVLIMLVNGLITSCGSTENIVPGTESVEDNSSVLETAVETTFSYDPKLPEADYEGYSFTFAVRGKEGSNAAWDNHDIKVENLNGEVLNDAIYERTQFIEDTYNVKIGVRHCGDTGVATSGSEMYKNISTAVLGGDADIDAIISSPYDTVGYAMAGFLLDMNKIEHLNLSQPWWDQNAIEQLALNKKIYFTTGEVTIIDNKATQIMLFIKDLIRDYSLDDPYSLVRSGKWTLDKFIEMSRAAERDLDGDGNMNENDVYGYIYWQDGCFGLIHSTGNAFGGINASGTPELTLYTDRMTSVWSKLIAFTNESCTYSIKNDPDVLKGQGADSIIKYMISGKHTLFSFAYVNHVELLRESDADFGIIPNPKFDEKQDEYFATAHGYGTALMSVPITNSNSPRTGLLLEAFAAKSMELVTPAFYDINLTGKFARDDESEEMLDLVFISKKYDMGYFFLWGDLTNKIMNAWNAKDDNLTSLYESAKTIAENDVKNTIELFAAHK